MNKNLSIVILGAGKGTRMKSNLPKVLHKIADRPMINLVLDTAAKLNPDNISLVISEEMAEYVDDLQREYPQQNLYYAIQKERLGTAHALQTGLSALEEIGKTILVLYADTPLLKLETLKAMISNLSEYKNSVCVLGFDCSDQQNKYGRLITKENDLEKIVEFKDAGEKERAINFCNSGVLAIDSAVIQDLLKLVKNDNASKEYYLTDIIGIAKSKKLKCGFLKADEKEVMGINSRLELAKAEKIKQKQIRNQMMENGVTLLSPKTVYFSFDTKIAADVVIHPHVVFGPGVEIESDVEIKSFSHLEGVKIENNVVVGPFARIRPGTLIHTGAKIGNFVEVKKSEIKAGAKINHLSYIGDSEVGEGANIGAGTITCNYDGYSKFKTKIGKNAFIGSNTALIAPVEVGEGAVIAAGSVINKNVDAGDLAFARAKQNAIKNGGKEYHKKREK